MSSSSFRRRRAVARCALVLGAGLPVLAFAAGCAATTAPAGAPPASAPAPSTEAAGAAATPTSGAVDTSGFVDGLYGASGAYTTPSGTHAIWVQVSLARGRVTAVDVSSMSDNPTAVEYEKQFASGISHDVVGRPISSLDVGMVSGSSLTEEGFNKAISRIETQARE